MRIDPEFERLYEREFPVVYRTVYLLTGDRAAAEDSTQEAFARCLERWGRLSGKPWVAGWVTTTAMNHVRRSLRRRARDRSTVGNAPPKPPVDPELAGPSVDLWRAVRTLPLRQQQALVLHYAMDLPVGEVAVAMGLREGTVKAHLARARGALRELIRPMQGEEEAPRAAALDREAGNRGTEGSRG